VEAPGLTGPASWPGELARRGRPDECDQDSPFPDIHFSGARRLDEARAMAREYSPPFKEIQWRPAGPGFLSLGFLYPASASFAAEL